MVNAFNEALNGVTADKPGAKAAADNGAELQLTTADLKPGMLIARDLVTRDGFLLLSAGHTLEERMIRQIRDFESSTTGTTLTIYIKHERVAE